AMKDSIGSHYMLAGAQDNGSHKFTSDGVNSTSEVTGGDGGFCFVDQDNPTYQITAYTRNRFYRSINGGNTFSSISSSTSGRFINPADYDDDANILYSAAAANQLFRVIGITGTIASSTLTIGGSGLGGVMPSIENIVMKIWEEVEPELPYGAELHCIKLYETENQYVEYYG
ncbi:6-carboxytetrahydropterin synthase, partial [Bacteroidia bacterium]|nr:6-carboxytetrahydropterin synthase [Bacteroidia bacterium]